MEWNLGSDRPIWLQLVEQLRQRIVTGIYPPGSKLPTVRELAAEAGVNPNTMQRALAQLEADGLAVSNRTSGRLVTDDEDTLNALRRQMAEGTTDLFIGGMEVLGYTPREAAALVVERGEEISG